MIPIIFPYKMGSQGAKALAAELDTKRVYAKGKYNPKENHLIINWGNSQGPVTWPRQYLNRGYGAWINPVLATAMAGNKLTTLKRLAYKEVPAVTFTEEKEEAQKLLEQGDARRIYCRKTLTGHSGRGIIVANTPEEIVDAPLYTVGTYGHRTEYRVHVFNHNVIDIQQKKQKQDVETVDFLVRNHSNGWIYAREGVELPEETQQIAVDAVTAMHLDFGAVDIIVMRDNPKQVFVLEINTAPGLEGTTVLAYANAIRNIL